MMPLFLSSLRERSSLRPSPDKGRTGGVCSGEMDFPRMIYRPKPPSFPPCQGGSRLTTVSSLSRVIHVITLEYKVIIKLIRSNLL
jgi:hypothetical protein